MSGQCKKNVNESLRACSFPPSARPDALVLILGSMPGEASLAAEQYYAHPRNAFWTVVEAVLGIPRGLPYCERLRGLAMRRVALWDVLASCVRPGSLDSDILESSIVPNEFWTFLPGHPFIRAIFFNGAKAEQAWRRHVLPRLPPSLRKIPCFRLPSTSPAHAGMTMKAKIEAWRAVKNSLLTDKSE